MPLTKCKNRESAQASACSPASTPVDTLEFDLNFQPPKTSRQRRKERAIARRKPSISLEFTEQTTETILRRGESSNEPIRADRKTHHTVTDAPTADDALSPTRSTGPSLSVTIPQSLVSMAIPGSASLRPLLVCALGNPGAQYAQTLHSAGLIALRSLSASLALPSFAPSRSLGGGGCSATESVDPLATLWLSGTYMNTSGPAVSKAWKSWPGRSQNGVLVIVHDELERALGTVSVRWEGSARGHNGLKSLQKSLPGQRYARIGIGIGRPVSRDAGEVSRFVLRKMSAMEMIKVQEAGVELESILRAISEGDEKQKVATR